jgi:hypothetical protein
LINVNDDLDVYQVWMASSLGQGETGARLAQVGDDDPALLATNNDFIGQLPKQPTEVFGRNPNEPGEVAKP